MTKTPTLEEARNPRLKVWANALEPEQAGGGAHQISVIAACIVVARYLEGCFDFQLRNVVGFQGRPRFR